MMNVQLKPQEFDADAARRALKNAIGIRLTAARDVENISLTIQGAETRIATMKERLNEFTASMANAADLASEALKNGDELVTPPGLVEAKCQHSRLVGDIEFATSGLVQLRATLEQKKRDLEVLTARAIEVLEPIVVTEGEELATEVARLESLASIARSKLVAFSQSGQGGHVQRLGPRAYAVLRNPPPNSIAPQTNTPLWRRQQDFKKSIIDWRAALADDAGAKLNLE